MMRNKQWPRVLIALMVSLGLWVYVVTVENPVQELEINNIPVTFSGEDLLREDYDLLVTGSNVSSGVTLEFSGKLSDLKKLQDERSEIQVTIDITYLRRAQEHTLSYNMADVTLPASVSSQDISLHAKSPSTVTLTLEKLSRVTIPVKIQQNLDLEENYMAGRLTQNYEEITIEGPDEIVRQVSYAQAILDRDNVDKSITATLPLTLIDNNGEIVEDDAVACSAQEVEVSLPVLMYKDVPLEVPIIYGGGISEEDVVVEPSPKTIRISGEPAMLEAIQSIKLSNIDVAGLLTNSEILTREIVVPDGVNNVSGESQATVSVEIKNKAIRQLRVSSSNFQYMGLPSDMMPSFRTTVLTVTVRANVEDIDQITEDNLRVVVDFTDYNLTKNMNMPVKIYVDGFDGAGVIAEAGYSVLVDVVSAEEMNAQ